MKKTKKISFDSVAKNIRGLFLDLSKEEVLESASLADIQLFLDEMQKSISVQKEILSHMESIRQLRQARNPKKGNAGRPVRSVKNVQSQKRGRPASVKMAVSHDEEWIDDMPLSVREKKVKEEYFEEEHPAPKRVRRSKGTQQIMFS